MIYCLRYNKENRLDEEIREKTDLIQYTAALPHRGSLTALSERARQRTKIVQLAKFKIFSLRNAFWVKVWTQNTLCSLRSLNIMVVS